MRARVFTPVLRALVPLAAVSVLTACATNPATGEKEISLMSEAQEIELGQQMDGQVRREMGVYDDPGLQAYVERVGMQLARASERPNLPWHFTVVDVPAVNAFALPGGYIYITRGILPFLDNEAQLAGVLGHEVGHVTARHAAQQYTKATGAGLGLALLSIFVPQAQPFEGVAQQALGVLFLKYGRDDELQADRLGVQYAAGAGWNPGGVAAMLTTLERLDEANGSRKGIPNWLSTHPAPADRVERIQPAIRQARTAMTGEPFVTDRADYLEHVNGIIYGDSPTQGIVRGNRFLHPALRFAVAFPQEWDIQNTQAQVLAKAPERNDFMLLQLVQHPSGSVDQIARSGMASAGFRQVNGEGTQIDGMDAYVGTYQGAMPDLGDVTVLAAHIVHDRNVYVLAGLAPPGDFPSVRGAFERSIRSFDALSRAEAAAIRPNRLDIYTARAGDTWQSIAARAGDGTVKPSTLAIMNDADLTRQPRPGDRLKVVVAG